jgi:hypothetical protein
MEDFLLTKAFIAASKDPIKGADQKGHVFMGTMVESYKILTAEQMRLDVTRLRDNQMLTSRAAVQAGTGNALQDLVAASMVTIYPARTPATGLFHQLFKKTIAPAVM